ncbi:MAG: P44/Msp2 family outer membrane protein [Wolbachia sp.]|nr:P44/Msp2 family outer membrane protein [Wolbachia sp.]MDD9336566.1 P44/Msp2 family outer membrane protein [Wolbachia sp.]
MNYKKFFSAAALVTLLSLSNSAFSDASAPIGPEDEDSSIYVRVQYSGEFLPFKTSIAEMKNTKGTGESVQEFDPFKASFVGGGIAVGYKMDDIRVDGEVLYSQLNKNAVEGATLAPDAADKLQVIAGLINVYYDASFGDDMSVTPYFGVGVGPAHVTNPLRAPVDNQKSGFGLAYQAKVGVSYDITTEIKGYVGARYLGSYGAKFDKTTKDDGSHKVTYSIIGAEAGVTFSF